MQVDVNSLCYTLTWIDSSQRQAVCRAEGGATIPCAVCGVLRGRLRGVRVEPLVRMSQNLSE